MSNIISLTHQQKLEALSLRFYQGLQWRPKAGDYYTTSRADLELYQVVAIEDGQVRTRYCDTQRSEAISSWPVAEFTDAGFGPKRVWVPEFVISSVGKETPMTDTTTQEYMRSLASAVEGTTGVKFQPIFPGTLRKWADELAAANARADAARDTALVEAETEIRRIPYGWYDGINAEYHHISAAQMRMDAIYAILALRDKPAPGVTPKIEVKFTWAKGDEEFWVHLKSPDGKSAGFNLGNPKGMIATALLRAIAGGGDEWGT